MSPEQSIHGNWKGFMLFTVGRMGNTRRPLPQIGLDAFISRWMRATETNTKCERFFTRADDGLAQVWFFDRVFLNPPYGKQIGLWMSKAKAEARRGALVVCSSVPALIRVAGMSPSRTSG
jgi:hypothetical protein